MYLALHIINCWYKFDKRSYYTLKITGEPRLWGWGLATLIFFNSFLWPLSLLDFEKYFVIGKQKWVRNQGSFCLARHSEHSCLLHSVWCLSNSDKRRVQHRLISALFMCTCMRICKFADMTHVCNALFTHCGHLSCLCLLDLYTHTHLFTTEGLWTHVRRQVHYPLV